MTNNRSEQCDLARGLFLSTLKELRTDRQPLTGTDVTPRMVEVMRHINASGPLTFSELRAHLGIARATITELVDRLEERGLVLRFSDDRDRRRVLVGLTGDGERQLAAVADHSREDPLTASLERMSAPDVEHLVLGLTALLISRKELP